MKQKMFLEGTGSLVLDRVNKTAYMAESKIKRKFSFKMVST